MKVLILLLLPGLVAAAPAKELPLTYPFFYREITCGKVTKIVLTHKNRPGAITIDAPTNIKYVDYDFDSAYHRALAYNNVIDVRYACDG